jgi:hypothetical protein
MFRLIERASSLTQKGTPFISLLGDQWVVREYARIDDAPPYTCLSYAWGEEKIRHWFNEDKLMSSRTVASLETAIAASQLQKTWAKNVKFCFNGDAEKEEDGQLAALKASQALWVDALCVPQYDPDRSACLQEMGLIFSAAFQVIVVLTRNCSNLISSISESVLIESSELLLLEQEHWINRAWTYQEAVNSRALYFIVDGEADIIVSRQDFLRAIMAALEDYKVKGKFTNITWVENHLILNNLEALLADYLIADFTDRSAYQVMSAMRQRISERPDDFFYAMIGSITTTPSRPKVGEPIHPAEYFMHICEQKGDLSFIYSTAARSMVPGQGWRPLDEKFSAVLPGLIVFGSGETGTREPTHIELEKMFWPLIGPINADGLKAAGWFMGPQTAGLSPEAIASGILKRLRVLGFTGCGEYLEFETGFFFLQSKSQISEKLFVVVSCKINWVTGGPGLLLRSNAEGINDFVDVGAFVGRVPKEGKSIKIR